MGDTTMTDMVDNGRPDGEPPDKNATWAQKVIGGGSGGGPRPEDVVDEAFVMDRMSLDFPDGEDGEAVITIGKEVLEAMNGLWRNCIIVKLLGRNLAISTLTRKLRELWRPRGGMAVMDLPRHFFMVRFENEDEYLAALSGGPWRVFGNYLLVQGWTPEFDPMKDEIVTTPVWVRFSNIPVNFYHSAILMGIAKGVGKPVRVDLTTLRVERARFARVCVEINLSKPLKGSLMINRARYFVSYEGLMSICAGCGIYGHQIHNCPQQRQEPTLDVQGDLNTQNTVPMVNESGISGDGFTVVSRRGQRHSPPRGEVGNEAEDSAVNSERIFREIHGEENMERPLISNRFANLSNDMEDTGSRDAAISQEMGKENSANISVGAKIMSGQKGQEGIKFAAIGPSKNGPGEKANVKKTGRNLQASAKGVVNGPRPRKQAQVKASMGLIFGQSREEIDRSESGKRLRMEVNSIGRPGGAFSGTPSQQQRAEVTGSRTETEPMVVLPTLTGHGSGPRGGSPKDRDDQLRV